MGEKTEIFTDPRSTVEVLILDTDNIVVANGAGGSITGVYHYLVDANAPSFE